MEFYESAEEAPHPAVAPEASVPKKVFLKTYGCQMNVYDSQRMGDALAADGYVPTDRAEQADLILLNTCHIREKAAEKVYSELGRLRKIKEERAAAGRLTTIGVAGCVAQAEGDEILRRAPVVDLVVGPQAYHRLPGLLRTLEDKGRAVDTDYAPEDKFEHLPLPPRRAVAARGVAAFLTVQEGCDKFCTFCVVPYTRGAEVSRPVAQILAEAERLAAAGVREVTLLGQNVNAWRGKGPDGGEWGLARLLFRLAEVPGLARLRYTTSHPRDMDDALIAAHRDLPALMPYLHLPVQSGSDRILKAMNRRHAGADYLRLDRQNPRRAPRSGAVGRLHRRLSRRERRGFRGNARAGAYRRVRPGVFLQIFAAARHAGRRNGRPGAGTGQGRAPAAPPGPAVRAAACLRGKPDRPRGRPFDREAGPPAAAEGRPLALAAAGDRG